MECDLPVPPAIAWAYVTDIEKKIRWQHGIDSMTMTGLAGGRIGLGATQHCAHGKDSTVHDIVDWRPFDYVTWHIRLPMGAIVRQTAELTPLENGGTHLSLRCAKPEGPNPGGDGGGADDHPTRHGQEACQRSTRLEGQRWSGMVAEETVAVHLAPARSIRRSYPPSTPQ